MNIGVRARTTEIGLLRALGAHRGQMLTRFLGKGLVLAALGRPAGMAIGAGVPDCWL